MDESTMVNNVITRLRRRDAMTVVTATLSASAFMERNLPALLKHTAAMEILTMEKNVNPECLPTVQMANTVTKTANAMDAAMEE